MKALLDTHVLLWWLTDAPQLPPHVRELLSDGDNELYFSAASCWEIAIKAGLGKIKLPAKPEIFIANQLAANAIQSLPIAASHALHVFNLPNLHRDPFDRILVAQSQLEGLPIITSDTIIARYKVKTIWEKK
jgi:PIN domain nuclease of toxin-antitoxin system